MEYHPHFTEEILEHSQTATRAGIDNNIPAVLRPNAIYLSLWLGQLEDKLQDRWPGARLMVSSGYRGPILNAHKDIGGSATSYHKLALAADIVVVWKGGKLTAMQLAVAIQSVVTDYDQLIVEFGRWVHVQLAQSGRTPRGERLTAKKEPNSKGEMKTVYLQGFVA